jgi:hypothetical protein
MGFFEGGKEIGEGFLRLVWGWFFNGRLFDRGGPPGRIVPRRVVGGGLGDGRFFDRVGRGPGFGLRRKDGGGL